MKMKLLVAIAIAMLGIASNAATYDWRCKCDYIATSDSSEGGDFTGYLVYFFDATTNSKDSTVASLATGLTALDNAIGSSAVNGEDGFNFTGNGLTDNGASPAFASGYFVILDSASTASAQHFWASDVVNVQITDAVAAGGATFAWDEAYPGATATWSSTGAVPEPTSGLLILLGMAGLALRRRRA